MLCKACGSEIKPDQEFCPKCLVIVPRSEIPKPAEPEPLKTKHNEIIFAKIKTKQDQYDEVSQLGPTIVFLAGIPCLFLYIIPGLILMGIGYWWGANREKEANRLENEINELKIELEYPEPVKQD